MAESKLLLAMLSCAYFLRLISKFFHLTIEFPVTYERFLNVPKGIYKRCFFIDRIKKLSFYPISREVRVNDLIEIILVKI